MNAPSAHKTLVFDYVRYENVVFKVINIVKRKPKKETSRSTDNVPFEVSANSEGLNCPPFTVYMQGISSCWVTFWLFVCQA